MVTSRVADTHPMWICSIRRSMQLLASTLVIVVTSHQVGFAQPLGADDPLRFLNWPAQDAASLFQSARGQGAIAIIGVGAAVYAIAQRDPALAEAIADASPSPRHPAVRAVEEIGNVRSVRPAALMLFLGSLASGDTRFQDASFTALESVIVANLLTNALKSAFGRARPYEGEGSRRFRPFGGSTSFPSGHSATAFAFTTPWLLYYPHPVTAGLVVLSAGTALSRVATNFHWVSDVVAGSGIGFATAYILSRSHMRFSEDLTLEPRVDENGSGFALVLRP